MLLPVGWTFMADAVGSRDRHAVRDCVPDHGAAPHPAGIEIDVIGFGTDGRRVEQHFGTLQRHHAGAFGIPLVPADTDADAGAELPAGQAVELLDCAGDWAWVACGPEGPSGYLRLGQLAPASDA